MPEVPTSIAGSRWPLTSGIAVVLVSALCLALRSGIALNHDAAWLMVAAGRLLAGGHYATDFFEVNLPQAIALYVPPQLLHERLGLPASLALMLWTGTLVVQSLILIGMIGARSGNSSLSVMATPWPLCWLALGLLVLPGNDFGQREHLAIILALPFLFMLAAEPATLPRNLRAYIALLAGIGLFIKPHFAPLPWLLLLIRTPAGNLRTLARSPEGLVMAAVALAEVMVLVLRFPDWFTCARWAGDLYGAFRQPRFWYQLDDSSVIASTIAFGLLLMTVRRGGPTVALRPFLVAAIYASAVYLLQGKGWPYQFLPAMVCVFTVMPLAWASATATLPAGSLGSARLPVIAAMLALLTQAGIAVREAPRAADLPHSLIGTALSAARRGDSVYVFSTSVAAAFPSVVDLDLAWASRYPSLWPLAGLAEAMQSPDPHERQKLARYAQPLADQLNADFLRYRPSIVIVDHRPHPFGLPPGFDILGFFLRDPAFRQTWSAYEAIGRSSDYDIYRDRSRAQDPLPASWSAPP